ncbi:MAG: cytochrome P460 family protein [Rhodovibrionaceae bacterium]|nr:cytochrome P460 family protein [Rhodovibrionaceae bacterium]
MTYPYEGTQPHGKVLEFLETEVTYEGHTGLVMVKKNYRGEGDPEEVEHAVLEDRQKHLASVTVMLRREDGYDPDHQNWFWAKYNADGSLATNPKDMKLAGRVAKGADKGCIACHQAAPGGDYVFTHDRLAK